MNTNKLKSFAQETRLKLINIIETKLNYILTSDTAELREKQDQINKLKKELESVPQDQLIEKVAYTWFNRFVALRFMDVNDYQPSKVRAITPKEGFTIPELLTDVKEGHFPEEINVNKKLIEDLLLNRVPNSDPQNEVYKLLLVAFCNSLNPILPFLFEKINDYTELLMPDDLLSDNSILKDIRDNMSKEDCENVEIIGWLYQFYISEKKDEVFASKSKVKKEDIPAATQLFTPRWIVEYMTQNSVGKLWLKSKPNSNLQKDMKYYIPSESINDEDSLKVTKPEELTVIDPACGSGHILVYAFELLTKIYEEEGYSSKEIPQLILQNNLTGLDIDERAAQLASFALMMKAREYNRRFFRNPVVPNISSFTDYNIQDNESHEITKQLNITPSKELQQDLGLMRQATNIGSLITPQANLSELEDILKELKKTDLTKDLILRDPILNLTNIIKQLIILKKQYTSVVANPPYMGGGKMNNQLSDYAKKNYPFSKLDLYAMFIDRGLKMLLDNGFIGYVTMESWMFLSTYEKFRMNIIKNYYINSLTHFGWHVMRIAFGTVAFIIENSLPENKVGTYSSISLDDMDKLFERPKVFPVKNNERYKLISQNKFSKILGSPIGYWASRTDISAFDNGTPIKQIGKAGKGSDTGKNPRFIRFFYEVSINKICLFRESDDISSYKFFKTHKGGGFRKWFGNDYFVVEWENNGENIKQMKSSNIRNEKYYFNECISWGKITSSDFSVRYIPKGSIADDAGPSAFLDNNNLFVLGFLNSIIAKRLIGILSPTVNFQVGDINRIPILPNILNNHGLLSLISENIEISKLEWQSKELSIDFKINPLVQNGKGLLSNAVKEYENRISKLFFKLHGNEEKLNRMYIGLYGYNNTIGLDVDFKKVSIFQKEIKSFNIGSIVRDSETGLIKQYNDSIINYDKKEIITNFISYAVGCIFGRYSLEREGFILADQGANLENYLKLVPNSSFEPCETNVTPIIENDWFKDSIYNQFKNFLSITFGEEHITDNLDYIESNLNKNLKKYFINDFFNDHKSTYNNRPIYWMFSSPKGAFKALVYMHRYNSDTINVVLNKYVREYLDRINNRKNELQRIIDDSTSSSKDVSAATKELDKLLKDEKDIKDYEENILLPMAQKRIDIDLDDGVLVNYNKLGKALEKVVGLNDPKTDKKVAGFDWVKR